jgi:glycosyltransferase involved in cell wall biosynthesis
LELTFARRLETFMNRVSVVVTTYNGAPYLPDTIAAALAQTHAPHEIIVVDDQSPDNTAEVIAAIGDPRVRYHRLPRNMGQNAATNVGFDLAEGDVIALLDQDDIWVPEKLARQLSALNAALQPESTVVFSTCLISGGGNADRVRPRRAPQGEPIVEYLLCRSGIIQNSTILLPAALARRVRIDERTRTCSDLGFCIDLERAGAQFVFMPERLSLSQVKEAEAWLKHYAPILSPREIAGFRARHIVPKIIGSERRLSARFVWEAHRARVLSTTETVALFAECLLPRNAYLALRRAAASMRPAWR